MGYSRAGWDPALAVRESGEDGYGVAGVAGVAAVAAESDAPAAVDPDEAEELGDRIAILGAELHAGLHRMLVLIARYDAMRYWELAGHRSCAHWLAFRVGLDLGTARERVRVARALTDLPQTDAAMSRGELSFSKVRAVTRAATAETEADLLEAARGCTARDLEYVVRAWKKGSCKDEAEWEKERHASRYFSVFPDDDGMYRVSGRLDPEVGALLMRAIEAATDALYRRRDRDELAVEDDREAAQRRADALGLLAERALAAGFGGRAGKTESAEESETFPRERPEAPISGTRAERYQVMLHVEPAMLVAGRDPDAEPGRSELEDGTRVPAETSRRLCCDAGLVRVTHDPKDGSVLDVGRKTRSIPPALRRALDVRDGGCRFPGCGLRFTDGHHIVHWVDGGETNLGNTLLLCRRHHRFVHEERWSVEWWGRGAERAAAFRDPRGQLHVARPRPAVPLPADVEADPAVAIAAANRLAGAADAGSTTATPPDAYTASARWKRVADIPDEVLFRATEALLT